MSKRNTYLLGMLFLGVFASFGIFSWAQSGEVVDFSGGEKSIEVIDDGFPVYISGVQEKTIGEFLEKNDILLAEGDRIFPDKDFNLAEGIRIYIDRKKHISLAVDGKTLELDTFLQNAEELLWEKHIELQKNDFLVPGKNTLLVENDTYEVVRVEIREERENRDIAFETIVKEDDSMGWQEEKVKKKGKKGEKERIYESLYHNEDRVEKNFLREEILRDPVSEIVTRGTYVELGKKHTGQASWYAWTGTLAAANPWLPKGSHVKVTNKANGKSVIVVINDRGPFVPGRIIDLDKVAFAKIASPGAGVIDVKMEEIKN